MNKKKAIKKILSLVLALMLIFSVVNIPAVESKAATGVVTNLRWSGTKKGKEISWTWDAFPGATGYKVVLVDVATSGVLYDGIVTTTSFTYKTKAKSQKIAIGVYVVDAVGVSLDYAAEFGYTYPVAPNTIRVWDWMQGTGSVTLRWYGLKKTSGYVPDGYEIKTTTLDGKKKKVYKMKTNCSLSAYAEDALLETFSKNIKGCKNAGFKVSIRSYKISPNGKKMYSAWSKAKAFVPAAKITKAYRMGSNGKAVWNPIKNATSYTIYRKVAGVNKLVKVKTVSGSSTSAVLPVSYFYSGLVVTANVRVKGKTYKSTFMKQYNRYYKYFN